MVRLLMVYCKRRTVLQVSKIPLCVHLFQDLICSEDSPQQPHVLDGDSEGTCLENTYHGEAVYGVSQVQDCTSSIKELSVRTPVLGYLICS